MNYQESIDYINRIQIMGDKLGLDNIIRLTEALGNPQKDLRFIHIAGTNGKGSAVSFLSHILTAAGYKTAAHVSPYLERYNERFQINNIPIPDDDLARITTDVKERIDELMAQGHPHPKKFEIETAVSLVWFHEQKCDAVVWEVGLGGRLDATNVIDTPELALITALDLEHTELLGNTLASIAYEKGGIIKENGDVLLYPQAPEARQVIEKLCTERNARLHLASFDQLRQ